MKSKNPMLAFFRRRTGFATGVFAFILVAGYVVVAAIRSTNGVPQEFTDARLQGALISQAIVSLSKQSATDLEKISELERRGNISDALTLAANVMAQSQTIRDKAVELSSKVEQMTRELDAISSFESRQAAIEAITNWLAMISRLINYSGDLGQLMDELKLRLAGARGSRDVRLLVEEVNAEARAINNFDTQAQRAIARFDALIASEK